MKIESRGQIQPFQACNHGYRTLEIILDSGERVTITNGYEHGDLTQEALLAIEERGETVVRYFPGRYYLDNLNLSS